jgi:hypothetical protein
MRVPLLTLLALSLLLGGSTQAQRAGGSPRGGGASIGIGGHPGFRSGGFAGRSRNSRNFGSVLFPFWYDEPYEYGDQPDGEAALGPPAAAPPVIIMQNGRRQSRVPETPAASPKLIEIPASGNSAAPKPQAPAIFILASGERLEARRYMLTASNLCITADREQRIVPLSMLDVAATVAANRERGIELHIPADKNEISLGF